MWSCDVPLVSAGAVQTHLRHIDVWSFQPLLTALTDDIHHQSKTDENQQHYPDHLLSRDRHLR